MWLSLILDASEVVDTNQSILADFIVNLCRLFVYYMSTNMSTVCRLYVDCMSTVCRFYVDFMSTVCLLYVYYMSTIC